MEDFTIRNYFKQWCKLLPITIILTTICLIAGFVYNSTIKQSYTASIDVLITGASSTIKSTTYDAIVNSGNLIAPAALEASGLKDSGCSVSGKTTDIIMTISGTCSSNGEDAAKLAESAADIFTGSIASILHNENVNADVIAIRGAHANVATKTRIVKIILPALVCIFVMSFIAFIKLDRVATKSSTKKSRKK